MAWWRGRKVLALGFDAGAITYRLKIGRLHPLHRGVYAVGHPIVLRAPAPGAELVRIG